MSPVRPAISQTTRMPAMRATCPSRTIRRHRRRGFRRGFARDAGRSEAIAPVELRAVAIVASSAPAVGRRDGPLARSDEVLAADHLRAEGPPDLRIDLAESGLRVDLEDVAGPGDRDVVDGLDPTRTRAHHDHLVGH